MSIGIYIQHHLSLSLSSPIFSGGFYRRAASVLSSLSVLFPTRLKVIEHEFPDRTGFRSWLIDGGFRDATNSEKAASHTSSPFVWISSAATSEPVAENISSYLGGHDDTLEWCRAFVAPTVDEERPTCTMVDDGFVKDHGYDYDLVVIGGGSGGMASAKAAADLGARVACLDFVKPSPAGTTWGLGGTCVNVGCIPKKLMHNAALLRESLHADSEGFGILHPSEGGEASSELKWEQLVENIQNHIQGLNFKYRVAFREKNVTYLNKLAKFKDAHTIEATDKKGKTSEITAARFLVAVGGRPTTLDCEGGELAITSDDIFSRQKPPGKTLCVGASYIALECAGFLAGFGNDVTIAVRSILLRGFDRECADRIGSYMEDHGVKFRRGVVPTKLEKVEDDKIQVTFSDDSTDVYDTVLVAIGRSADTGSLGLEKIGVTTNPSNKKIICKNEQSACPNVYAVGDVMEGCPELTPVAIQAGQYLANRLFGISKEPMDYVNICTTVFTPIEYGTVGISEDTAIEQYGAENVECYIREFIPLEWSLSHGRGIHMAFVKVVTDKMPDENVLGIHYLGPNAGEVLQGYGVSMKRGLKFGALKDTVGIHPTSSEEIVTLAIKKSSGESASAGGC